MQLDNAVLISYNIICYHIYLGFCQFPGLKHIWSLSNRGSSAQGSDFGFPSHNGETTGQTI